MSPDDWRHFLRHWSDDWLSRGVAVSARTRTTRWLGFPPATDQQLLQSEKRLGYELPTSYRNFLKTTNGWSRTSELIERIRPCSKVEWLEAESPETLDVWAAEPEQPFDGVTAEDYFAYDGRPIFLRDHLRRSLLIADPVPGDSLIYVLNPLVVAEDGEWEAWRFATWIPGAERFPSFELLMRAEYAAFRGEPSRVGPYEGVYAPDRPRHHAKRIGGGRPKPRRLSIPELIAQLESADRKTRTAAANRLLREFKPHDPQDEHPELVAPLERILRSNLEVEVRSAAAAMLGSYGDTRAIPLLIEALADERLTGMAISALFYLSLHMHDSRIGDAMVNVVKTSRDYFVLDKAILILQEVRDPRVAQVGLWLLDQAPTTQFNIPAAADNAFATAHQRTALCMSGAFAFARFAEAPTNELISRLSSSKAEIRAAAVAALREDPNRGPHLKSHVEPLSNDSDDAVRQQASTTLRFLEPVPAIDIPPEQLAEVQAFAEAQLRRVKSQKTNRF